MKKFFMVVALAAMTIGYSSCGGSESKTDDSDSTKVEGAMDDSNPASPVQAAQEAAQGMLASAMPESVDDYFLSKQDFIDELKKVKTAEDATDIIRLLWEVEDNEDYKDFVKTLSAEMKTKNNEMTAEIESLAKKAGASLDKEKQQLPEGNPLPDAL